ncbi:MAG: hypothetical protein A2Z57_12070 [Planctomycetes bacterium RIFCSPHIGHO2_12_39_6]|nr:MAG: hypothetical protein A2Z57_12070 [Planctomycetes bacterium RIFCSPHIGHO2_12_39_6]
MKNKFIPTNNDLSYYPLLYKALEDTVGDIIEMGTGHGSTPLLHEYCTSRRRKLHSYETDKKWLAKFEQTANEYHSFTLIDRGAWDACSDQNPNPSVVFIDHAPGERRKDDLIRFKDSAEIIVIHDTEPTGAGDYRVRPLFKQFKYVVEVMSNAPNPHQAGAWATALSNTVDITKWIGQEFGNYKIVQWQK